MSSGHSGLLALTWSFSLKKYLINPKKTSQVNTQDLTVITIRHYWDTCSQLGTR